MRYGERKFRDPSRRFSSTPGMIQETEELHINDSGFARLATEMMDAMVRQR
jgi:hypothetical protein